MREPTKTTTSLLERERPLGRLSARLRAGCAGNGSLVLVEGPAGIGKSSLLEAGAAEAALLGMQILRARGDEVSVDASFAAVRELLWSHRAREAGSAAAAVFDGDAGGAAELDRSAAILHGLYWMLADLAEKAPVLVVLDDAHWLDGASLRFIAYLARRLASLPVVVLVGRRPGEGTDPARGQDLLGAASTELLELTPLSRAAGRTLIRRRLGPHADDALCEHCHWATGGNPFYLGELVTAIDEISEHPTVEAARAVTTAGTEPIVRSVRHRLAALGPDCERLATAVSLLTAGTPLRIAAALAELEPGAAQRAADRLRAAGLMSSAGDPSLSHPLVRSAVAEAVPVSERRALHRRAAQALASEAAEPDAVAAHLLLSEPLGDPWAIDALRAAAATATARGAPETAIVYLRRALAEPPAPAARFELLRELGRAEIVLPAAEDSPALREALTLAPGPRERAEVTLELAAGIVGRGVTAGLFELAEATLAEAEQLPGGERLEPMIVKALEAIMIGAAAPDLSSTQRALARTRRYFDAVRDGTLGDEPWLAPALSQAGPVLGMLRAAEGARLAGAVVAAEYSLSLPITYIGACGGLYWCDRLDAADRALARGLEHAQRIGSPAMFMLMSVFCSAMALQRGELAAAEAHALRGHELFLELAPSSRGNMFLAQVLTTRGRPDAALEMIGEVISGDPDILNWQDAIAIAERGRARVALGDLRAGVGDLLRADARMAAEGCQLSVLCDWVPVAVPALVELGDAAAAEAIAEREMAEAQAFGARRRHAAAHAVTGSLSAEPAAELQLLAGVELVRGTPARLQLAASLLALGTWRVRQGRGDEAREPLGEALDLADRADAGPLAAAALSALRAAGARPRRTARSGLGSLTASELRTARLAADGQPNREIARNLFVSTKTVEAQLSSAYRKLGVAGRRELGAALAREAD